MFSRRNIKRNLTKFFQQPGYGVRVFFKRLKADIFYRVKPAAAPMPEAVTLFLTYMCNLRCRMCGQWGDSGVTKKKTEINRNMDIEEVKKIVDELSGFKPNITLFGGEPLLHKDIIEIIRHVKSKGMHCLMITNAFLLEKFAGDLMDAGIDELNISLDGPGEIHDDIRGIEGLFDRIFTGVKKITDNRKNRLPLINLQTTITKYNYRSLKEMPGIANDAGADSITFHHLIYLHKDDIEKTKDRHPFLEAEDWGGFVMEPGINPEELISSIETINSMKKDYPFMINVYPNFKPDEIRKYYTDPSWFPPSYKGRCMSPWICAYIFPDGELHPCLDFGYSFGNLNEKSFRGAWNSPEAEKFRSLLKEEGMFPVCKRCTEIFRY